MDKIYFSSTTSVPRKFFDVIGIMETPNGIHSKFVKKVNWWCLDSGTFTKELDMNKWKHALKKLHPHKSTCRFVVIPDKVFDYKQTLKMFFAHYEYVKELGYPCALVSQDGLTPKKLPRNLIDVLFIGGSNEHKLGIEARRLIDHSKENGIPVHVGRVNSIKRLKIFSDCDSWDGTHFGFYPKDVTRFAKFIRTIEGNRK